MSEESKRNSVFNTVSNSKVHHAKLDDIKQYTPQKMRHLQRGGIRSGAGRTETQTQQMLEKIPPSQRVGTDGQSAAIKAKTYLNDKDASHIKPHSQGGSTHPDNIKWENKTANRTRGNKLMTDKEQRQLDIKLKTDNLKGGLQAGFQAAPKGALIGAVTTAPFPMLANGLRVARGKMTAKEALKETIKETSVGAGVGASTAFMVTSVAAACPPIATALIAVSPALLLSGGIGMIYEFFKILDEHQVQVKEYYESLSQQDLDYLEKIEDELLYEHSKNLEYFRENQALNDEIKNRPIEPGVEGALKRYLESSAIAESLGAISLNDRKFPDS